ncbi:MAG: hypothetical protein C4289_00565 [Chloroflexota bacterium]
MFFFGALMLGNVIFYVQYVFIERLLPPAKYGVLVTLTSISDVLTVLMRRIQAWVIKGLGLLRQIQTTTMTAGGRSALCCGRQYARVLLGALSCAVLWLPSGWIAGLIHLKNSMPVVLLGLSSFSSLRLPVPSGISMRLNQRLVCAGTVSILEPAARGGRGHPCCLWPGPKWSKFR